MEDPALQRLEVKGYNSNYSSWERLKYQLYIFTCWPAGSILRVGRGQAMPRGWKTDMGDGRTHPTSEMGRGPRALAACFTWLEEGEHFQLLKMLCRFSVVHGRATLGT